MLRHRDVSRGLDSLALKIDESTSAELTDTKFSLDVSFDKERARIEYSGVRTYIVEKSSVKYCLRMSFKRV